MIDACLRSELRERRVRPTHIFDVGVDLRCVERGCVGHTLRSLSLSRYSSASQGNS
ncbi:hypothetical protein THIOM_002590 [Candidatus Thiomargarita nelsonii]|uniref:Uncharacterized protein n=1 Tax=Candidatus Thiomargarita nelsonii TaxID=1003181 RepID=A0A176S132_9GAMM|nr:hypothetical protein THIOM_002590 [Candidatus Thiomargarita nelsonii]